MSDKKKITSSPIDSIIIDMILEHYNIQSTMGRKENLSGDAFQDIVDEAQEIYFNDILIKTKGASASY